MKIASWGIHAACYGEFIGFFNSYVRASYQEVIFLTDMQFKSDIKMKFWHRKRLWVELHIFNY